VPQLLNQLQEQRAAARRGGDEILNRAAAEGRDLTPEELTAYQLQVALIDTNAVKTFVGTT
jgi:hypothetical protein